MATLASGIGLFEVFHISGTGSLVNLSTRGPVLTGDNVMIGGFMIRGEATKVVVQQAVGPDLTSRGVSGALEDPTVEVYSGSSLHGEQQQLARRRPSGSDSCCWTGPRARVGARRLCRARLEPTPPCFAARTGLPASVWSSSRSRVRLQSPTQSRRLRNSHRVEIGFPQLAGRVLVPGSEDHAWF